MTILLVKPKEEIIEQMVEVMPFELSDRIKPYILEAMDVYAKKQLESLKKENEELEEERDKIIAESLASGMILSTQILELKKRFKCPECSSNYIEYTEYEYWKCNSCDKDWINK